MNYQVALLVMITGVLTATACKTPKTTSETKTGVFRGPDGRTYVYFQSPANTDTIIGRQCPEDAVIRSVGDIDRVCPRSEESTDRRWATREAFIKDFKNVFYMRDVYPVAKESDYGDLLDYKRDLAEQSLAAKRDMEQKLTNFRELLRQAREASASADADYYENKIAELNADVAKISDLSALVQRFNRFIDDLADDVLNQVRVITFFSSSNPNHRFIVEALHTMYERGPTQYLVYCRVCRQHYRSGSYRSESYECDASSISKEAVFAEQKPCASRNRSDSNFRYTEIPDDEKRCWEESWRIGEKDYNEVLRSLYKTCEGD